MDSLSYTPATGIITVVNPRPDDTLVCVCGWTLYLDPSNGWRNDTVGYACVGASVHTNHIHTIITA